MTGRGQRDPRRANGHRRDQVVKRVKAEESDCWLCGKPVDKTLGPHQPGSPEVDEVIPVSAGGSPTDRRNCRLAHRACNRERSDKAAPSPDRSVVLVCGPPGAGKTTLAQSYGVQVYDVDEPQWFSEHQFREALRILARTPAVHAAVIRSAATLDARRKAARLCGATSVVVVDTDYAECVARIRQRGRTDPPIRTQIAAARDWWAKYEPGDVLAAVTTPCVQPLATSRSW